MNTQKETVKNFDVMSRLQDCANGDLTNVKQTCIEAQKYINTLRKEIEFIRGCVMGAIAGNELNLEELDHVETKLNYWRHVAELLYTELVKEWCWHCGVEKSRHNGVDEAIQKYREACANV